MTQRLGTPPRTTHTPSATGSSSVPANARVAFVRWLKTALSPRSACDPTGGTSPICRAMASWGMWARLPCRSPSWTWTTSQPVTSMRAPLGFRPWKVPGPAKVPVARQSTAQRSPSVTVDCTANVKSGNAPKISLKYERTPSGATRSWSPTMLSIAPGAQHATIASTSRAVTAAI